MDPDQLATWNWPDRYDHRGTRIDRQGHITRLEVDVAPTFSDKWKYELLAPVPSGAKPALAVKTVRHNDIPEAAKRQMFIDLKMGRVIQSPPLVEEFALEIDPKIVDDLWANAAGLQISIFPGKAHFGLDGTIYRLAVGSGRTAARYRWWMSPPEGWEPLAGLVKQIIAVCE